MASMLLTRLAEKLLPDNVAKQEAFVDFVDTLGPAKTALSGVSLLFTIFGYADNFIEDSEPAESESNIETLARQTENRIRSIVTNVEIRQWKLVHSLDHRLFQLAVQLHAVMGKVDFDSFTSVKVRKALRKGLISIEDNEEFSFESVISQVREGIYVPSLQLIGTLIDNAPALFEGSQERWDRDRKSVDFLLENPDLRTIRVQTNKVIDSLELLERKLPQPDADVFKDSLPGTRDLVLKRVQALRAAFRFSVGVLMLSDAYKLTHPGTDEEVELEDHDEGLISWLHQLVTPAKFTALVKAANDVIFSWIELIDGPATSKTEVRRK